MIKICKQCNKEFNAKNKNVKYCCKQCYSNSMITTKIINCPICNKKFKQTNAKQKYCSKKCAGESSINSNNILECPTCKKKFNKNKTKTNKYCSKECYDIDHKLKVIKKSCKQCGKEFETNRQNAIYCSKECKNICVTKNKTIKVKQILKKENTYICKLCGNEIKSKYIKRVFCSNSCRNEWLKTDKGRKEQSYRMKGKTSTKRGTILSKETKKKISISTKKGMKKAMHKKGINWQPFFNEQAAKYFIQFDEENNTKGQHALNGGERHIYNDGNMFIDYINDDLKLIIEYDEPYHKYKVEEDLLREKRIKEKLPEYKFVRIDDTQVDSYKDFKDQVNLFF